MPVESALSARPVELFQAGAKIDAGAVDRLRSEFSETGIAYLPGFLSPPLLDLVLRQVAATDLGFRDETNKITGEVFGTTRRAAITDTAIIALHFILNRPELFTLASDVSGIERPGNFLCRLHRTEPAPEQHIDWHDDAADGRVLGLDINLSPEPYEGGLFQIRAPGKIVKREVLFAEPGDAFLFRIGSGWQHRLTPVTSGTRTVAVGWFRQHPDWEAFALSAFHARSFVCKGN